MSDLNLHAMAAEVLTESASPDPGVMAQELVGRISPEDYGEALLYLSRALMRELIRGKRSNNNGGSPNATGSRKVQAVRHAWRQMLDTPEFISSSGWVFLRDATHTQVLEMAGARNQKSQELRDAAERYKRLAASMKAANVMRVADLPEDLLSTVLTEKAAA